jgi:hypothetical protein
MKVSMERALASSDLGLEISRFNQVYAGRPLRRNLGGMRYNHSFALWFMLRALKPEIVIESGVWQGHSTWLIEQACPDARLICLDIDFSRLLYKSAKADYIQKDFAECSWTDVAADQAVCFFDDHQNAYQRLKDMRWAGFTRAIFEDNYPCGEGDFYSLRQMLKGCGHPHLQLSEKYMGDEDQRQRRQMFEDVIRVAGPRQQLLVPPNGEDKAMFERNCRAYFEFPPVALTANPSTWSAGYEGDYEAKPPLFSGDGLPDDLKALMASDAGEFDYNYIAFVELIRP